MGTLEWERVRELKFDVELTLKRGRQSQDLDAAQMAVNFFGQFLAIPDTYKPVAAPLFAAVYRTLEIDNAEDYFRRIEQIATAAESEQAAGNATENGNPADRKATHTPPADTTVENVQVPDTAESVVGSDADDVGMLETDPTLGSAADDTNAAPSWQQELDGGPDSTVYDTDFDA